MTDAVILEAQGLTCAYGFKGETVALKNISLRISEGEFVVVSGPNGAGKTTLLGSLSGVIPSLINARVHGEVRLMGRPILDYEKLDLARFIAVVLEDPDAQLFGSTVFEYLAFGLELRGLSRDVIISRVHDVAKTVRISGLLDRECKTLSGGEKQRAVVASMLVLEPKIIVLDEPTSQLDPAGTRQLFNTLQLLNSDEGLTVVIASHKLADLAGYASRLLVMDDARLVAVGDMRDILSQDLQDRLQYAQASQLHISCKRAGLLPGGPMPLTIAEGVEFVKRVQNQSNPK